MPATTGGLYRMEGAYPKRILAFDPGGTTGYAIYHVNDRGNPVISKGELKKHYHHAELYDFIYTKQPDVIVTERFDYRGRQRSVDLIPVEYIGVMRLYSQLHDVELIEQPQLKGKQGLWTDDKLKVLGLHSPSKGGHANDAVRQLLWFITSQLEDNYFLHAYRRMSSGKD